MGGLLALGCSQRDLLAMLVGRRGESEKSSEESDDEDGVVERTALDDGIVGLLICAARV